MLAVTRRRLNAGRPASIHILQADLTNFRLQAHFALVFLPCNTLSTLAPDARRSMLERTAQHLLPGGLFAASLPNPALLTKLPAYSEPEVEETFPHPLDGEPVQVSSAWKRTARFFTLFWHYDHLLPDGQIERLSAQTRHHLDPAQTYLEELRHAGFEVVELFGDFQGVPYTEDAPNLILTAVRKAS
jgi:SAM-dependent methyltransferase